METLLISPAKRSEIVLGKFLTVLLFSLSTTVLNLVSLGFTGWFVASGAVTGTLSRVGVITFPGPLAIVWILLLLAPLAAFFSALSLALATFARSSKEGHYYLYPLLMVTLGLTIFCLSPAVEIEPFFSVMPVVGVALLLKELLASPGSTQPLVYVIPVLTASIAYSLLALWWAIDQFKREEVLFREAERFELRLWIRHLLRDKEPLPSFSEAVVCFILIMFLQFASIRFFQRAIYASPDSALSGLMLKLLIVQQLVIIASPALLMGLLLTASFRRTFRFRWPRWQMLGVAAALPLALHPLTVELAAGLEWFFPELPQEIHDVVALMSDQSRPVWLVLLVFAAAPALCEEFAFRGFILSGFSRTGRVWLAIFFSSAMFGIMHMIPQQVFNATLLGLVLGLIAVRSKSLLPCMLFHFLYNATEILRGRVDPDWFQETPAEWFVTVKSFEGQQILHYGWPTLVVATIVVVVLLRWLIGHSAREAVPPTIVSTPVDAHPLSY